MAYQFANLARHGHHGSHHYAGEAALIEAENKLERRKDQDIAASAKNRAVVGALVSRGAAGIVAGGLGYWQAYKGMPEVLGVGVDLVAAGAFTAVEVYSILKGKSIGGHMGAHAIGGAATGAFCFWMANQGNLLGKSKRDKEAGTSTTAGFDYEGAGTGELPPDSRVRDDRSRATSPGFDEFYGMR